jgi:glycosyltransferase involved in cell wall biosynthesis
MIMKNEEDVVGDAVRAVRPLVDEVVVYDTGSTDRSIEIAEAAGARVVRGYWNEHFGDARNRALEHCSGDWILAVDADERAEGDPSDLRRFLATQAADLAQVVVTNTAWAQGEEGYDFRPVRLFRRERCHWSGALHEMVVSRHDGSLPSVAPAPAPLRLIHSGYQVVNIEAHDKLERNLRIARAAADAWPESGDPGDAVWCNYGRALADAGHHEEALDALRRVLEQPGVRTLTVLAGRAALLCLAHVSGERDEYERWLDLLAEHGESRSSVAVYRAWLALRMGETDRADELVRELPITHDVWGVPFDPDTAVLVQVAVLRTRGRPVEALELLLGVIERHEELVSLRDLMLAVRHAGRALSDVVAALPSAFVDRTLRHALYLNPVDADAWLEAVWTARSDRRALVSAAHVAPRLRLERTLAWELRMREAAMADARPLRAFALDEHNDPLERCRAWAVLAEVLMEPDARGAFDALVSALDAVQRGQLADSLRALFPGLESMVAAQHATHA